MNGRTYRSIEEDFSKFKGASHNDWAKCLQTVMMAYTSSIHAMTKYSPLYLIFDRPCSMPIDCRYKILETKTFESPSDYVRDLKKELQQTANWCVIQ